MLLSALLRAQQPKRLDEVSASNNLTHHALACPAAATSGHHFKVNHTVLCVPQKNGNRNWGGFIFYWRHGKPPASVQAVLGDMHHFDSKTYGDGDGDAYIIARSPYARFLSEYLNHQSSGCISKAGLGCNRVKGPPTQSAFRSFAESTLTRGEKAACGINHHLCSQVRLCASRTCLDTPPFILKLENQAQWFDWFVNRVGVGGNGLYGEAWKKFSGQSGFYLPPSASTVAVGHAHATNASGRLATYYTEDIANLVTGAYRHDFEAFGYCKGYHCIVNGSW